MGHTIIKDKNNSLYGFKTDLKEKLRKRQTPRWVSTDYIHVEHRHKNITVSEAFEIAAEQARRKRNEYDTDNPTWTVRFPLNTGRGFMAGRNQVPEKIWEKLSISVEDARRQTGFYDVSTRGYCIVVSVGPREGIEDLWIGREFHH